MAGIKPTDRPSQWAAVYVALICAGGAEEEGIVILARWLLRLQYIIVAGRHFFRFLGYSVVLYGDVLTYVLTDVLTGAIDRRTIALCKDPRHLRKGVALAGLLSLGLYWFRDILLRRHGLNGEHLFESDALGLNLLCLCAGRWMRRCPEE
jgi:hypothetical protein